MNLKRQLIVSDYEENEGRKETPPPGTPPWNPGWYPDPSAPAVVRWWDGKRWTKFTAPNDAHALSRGAPRDWIRILVTAAVVVLVVCGVSIAAVYLFVAYQMSQWASNK